MTGRDDDDLFGDTPEHAQMIEELDRHGDALYQCVSDYMDEEELDPGVVSDLLFEIALKMRMVGYGMEVEKPSTSGLKLDLDRCRRELDDLFRAHKKHADEFIASVKEARAALAAEAEGEGGA